MEGGTDLGITFGFQLRNEQGRRLVAALLAANWKYALQQSEPTEGLDPLRAQVPQSTEEAAALCFCICSRNFVADRMEKLGDGISTFMVYKTARFHHYAHPYRHPRCAAWLHTRATGKVITYQSKVS